MAIKYGEMKHKYPEANMRFSFVATSRNDDHGGDVLQRTQTFINSLAEQCNRHQLDGELILVDWNPPSSRVSLADVLDWPAGSRWFRAIHIVVPAEIHNELQYSMRLPMFQMIAKNVGIRRASGQFIIATNIDIVFSDALFERLNKGLLRERVLYRSDRWDIPNELQFEPTLSEFLKRAPREAIRYHRRDGTFIRDNKGFKSSAKLRFDDVFFEPLINKLAALQKMLHQGYSASAGMAELLENEIGRLRRRFLLPDLHVNGCGDFTMLSKDDWMALRGYPEWQIFSWNIDAVLLFQAHFNGIRVEEMDRREVHYHIEHGHGSGWTPEGAESLWERLERLGIPMLSYEQFLNIVYELQENADKGMFTLYNNADWGFSDRNLPSNPVVSEGTTFKRATHVNDGPLHELTSPPRSEVIQVPLEHAVALNEGVGLTHRLRPEGDYEAVVQTLPEAWSYAICFSIDARAANRSGEHWFRIRLRVESGNVGVGLLTGTTGEILRERQVSAGGERELILHTSVIENISAVLFRNAGADNQPAHFSVISVSVDAETIRRIGAHVKAWSDEAIVRTLEAMPAIGEHKRLLNQVLVVTPQEAGATAALLDLGDLEKGSYKVKIHVHTMDGEVGIGIQGAAEERILREHAESAGNPFVCIPLSIDTRQDSARLIIRNLSAVGKSRMLLQGLECHLNPM
jgi:hypothetical protein